MSLTRIINPRWLSDGPALGRRFATASPFPHVVMDEFLAPDFALLLSEAFPPIDAMPRSRDYVFGSKRELSSLGEHGEADRAYRDALLTDEFASWLGTVTGEELFIDPRFHGGGFHQGGDGSFLDMHVDFNLHPENPRWLRRANLLLYLSPDWDPDVHGGHLTIRGGQDGPTTQVAPLFNRAVLMLTDEHTYHGYRRLSLPPGTARRSIAAYGYRQLAPDEEVGARTTGWEPDDAGFAKALLARNWDRIISMKTRLLGSGTSRNR